MSTPPATNQIVRIPGELQVDTAAGYKQPNGLISFIGPFNQKLGQIRAYGFGGFQSLLMDSSNCAAGFEVRTTTNQGDATTLNGKGDQFPLTINGEVTKIKSLEVTETATQYKSQFSGASLMRIIRQNTTATTQLANSILDIFQNQWKVGESMQVVMGGNPYGGTSVWSYTQPTSTSSSAVDNYSSLSMRRNNVTVENVRMFTTGDVSIPATLTAGTISATTYLNLPPVVPSQLLPLTLKPDDGRVGINNANPITELDVNGGAVISGDVLVGGGLTGQLTLGVQPGITGVGVLGGLNVSGDTDLQSVVATDLTAQLVTAGNIDVTTNANVGGTLTAGTVSATTYLNLPPVAPSQLLPLTLDKTNHRVGINNVTPTCPLDIVDTGPEIFLGKTNVARFLKPAATVTEEIGILFGTGTDSGTAYIRAINDFGVKRGVQIGLLDPGRNNLLTVGDTLSTFTSFVKGYQFIADTASLWALVHRVNGVDYNLIGKDGLGDSVKASQLTSVGTLTSLAVSGNLTVDTSTLVVDAANNRVGINKAVPTVACDIVGTTNVQGVIECTSIVSTQSYFSTTDSNGIKLALRGSENSNIATSTNQVNFCAPDPSSFVFYSGGTNNDGVEILRVNSSGLILQKPITLPAMVAIPGPGQVGYRVHQTLLADTPYTGNMSVVSITLAEGTWTVQGCAAIMPVLDPCYVYWTMIALNFQSGALVNNVATGELVERNVSRQELWPGGGVWSTTLMARTNMILTEPKTIHVNLNLGLNTPTDVVNLKATESYIVATRIG